MFFQPEAGSLPIWGVASLRYALGRPSGKVRPPRSDNDFVKPCLRPGEGLTSASDGSIIAPMRWQVFRSYFPRIFEVALMLLLTMLLLRSSTLPAGDQYERARAFTRALEFDYLTWTLDAVGLKLGRGALNAAAYLPQEERSQVVVQFLQLLEQIWQVQAEIEEMYADPAVDDPQAASAELSIQLEALMAQRAWLQPLAESILEAQVSQVAAEAGLTLGGQALPPVLYHMTPPPAALIISPREVVQQDHNISVSPDLTTEEIEVLEAQVDAALDVSSLVVGIGGIGVYPTMVMETNNLNWLAEVVAHEWIHNYLTLRPLGLNYLSSPELRTMNEMAASIAGMELGEAVIRRFYPAYLPPNPSPFWSFIGPPAPQAEAAFNYRAEMHETRVTADRLLAEGEIEAAERYMEMRRRFLWDNGYHIRKLNQAFFAFYGAYADASGRPGGAAGEDPVAAAVRTLRDQSKSLATFINRMAWMASYEALQRAILPER